jgi:hypothetical protein
MIYETVLTTDPIEQGDIFQNIPRVDFSLSSLAIIDEDDEAKEMTWRDALALNSSAPVSAVLAVKPVAAIVVTQNCDASRGQTLSLCQIEDYLSAFNQAQPPKNPKGWQSLLMRMSRMNPRFFYLPEDGNYGIATRSAVDFRIVLPVPRIDLENMRDLRIARLNKVAAEHFREALSNFFRGYAFNEWYPLNREEFAEYAAQTGEHVAAFDWQK